MRTPAWCASQAGLVGPACAALVGELLAVNALFPLRQAQGVLRLGQRHGDGRLEAACARALESGDPSYRTVKGILAAGTEHDGVQLPLPGAGGAWPGCAALTRSARSSGDRREPGRARPGAQATGPVRHARHPGGAAGRGPRRHPRPRRAPPGAVRGRARPPRRRQDHPADQGRPLPRCRRHLGDLRLRLQPQAARRRHPRPGPAGVHRGRGGRSWPTARSGSASPTWPPRWATRPAAAATTSPSPPAPGCWPTWPAGTPTAASRPASAISPRPPCSSCDDFAMREFTAAQADDLYELVTERIGRPGRSLILTSNRSPADWYPLFPNAVVGESILDRVLNTSHHLLLDGKSYRPRRRPGQHKPGPGQPAPAMTRRWRLRRRSLFRRSCRARAGGRAAHRVRGRPPGLKGACASPAATALRAALDPGDPCGPWRQEKRAGPSLPQPSARRVRRTGGPHATDDPANVLTRGGQQPHYRHQGPGAELRDRHPRELADRPHRRSGRRLPARTSVIRPCAAGRPSSRRPGPRSTGRKAAARRAGRAWRSRWERRPGPW